MKDAIMHLYSRVQWNEKIIQFNRHFIV